MDIPGEGTLRVTDWKWTAPKTTLLHGGTQQQADYDGFLELTSLRAQAPDQSTLFELHNRYGKLGELAQSTKDGNSAAYTYDAALRLTGIDGGTLSGRNESYQLDATNNRTRHDRTGSDTWTYDAANQLTTRGPLSYQYDAAGNQIKKTDTRLSEPARTTHYAYDAFNRLSEVTNGASERIARYTYDPFDRRLSKTLGTGATGQPAGTTWYLPSDNGLRAEADEAGTVDCPARRRSSTAGSCTAIRPSLYASLLSETAVPFSSMARLIASVPIGSRPFCEATPTMNMLVAREFPVRLDARLVASTKSQRSSPTSARI